MLDALTRGLPLSGRSWAHAVESRGVVVVTSVSAAPVVLPFNSPGVHTLGRQ